MPSTLVWRVVLVALGLVADTAPCPHPEMGLSLIQVADAGTFGPEPGSVDWFPLLKQVAANINSASYVPCTALNSSYEGVSFFS